MRPEARELQQLAFDHVLREVDQDVEDREIALAQRHLERLHVQPVAGEHAHVIAPASVGAGASAARLRAVDHVVVDQRGAVDHLHHRAQPNRALARDSPPLPPPAAAAPDAAACRRLRAGSWKSPRPARSRRSLCAAISCSTSARSSRTRSKIPFAIWTAKAIRSLYLPDTACPGSTSAAVEPEKIAGNSQPSWRQFLRRAKFLTFAKACATSTTKGGLVSFSAASLRRKKRRIRLGEHAVERELARHVAQMLHFRIGDVAAKEIMKPMSRPRRASSSVAVKQ